MQIGLDILSRMEAAVLKVRERMVRAADALEAAGIPHAIAGGNPVAAWVATVDEAAVRNTRDVDIVLRREDLPAAKAALEGVGFAYRHTAGVDMFLDGSGASARDAVHVLFAGEKVRPDAPCAVPPLGKTRLGEGLWVLPLADLTRVELASNRIKNGMHLRDLIDVGLLGEADAAALEPPRRERLLELLADPDG